MKTKIVVLVLFLICILSSISAKTIIKEETKFSSAKQQDEYYNDVTPTDDGGYILSGNFNSWGTITKYNSNGEKSPSCFFGAGNTSADSVKADKDGNIIAAGYTKDNNVYDNSDDRSSSKGGYDAFIIKYNENFEKIWVRTFGGSAEDYFSKVIVTKDGGYLCIGYTTSVNVQTTDGLVQTSVNPSNSNYNYTQGLLVKYDKLGNLEWSRTYNNAISENYYSVIENKDGDYIITGWVVNEDNNHDVILMKYNSSGELIWSKVSGTANLDCVLDLKQDKDGSYFGVGYTSHNIIENSKTIGLRDYYITKFAENGDMLWQKYRETDIHYWYDSIILNDDGEILAVGTTQQYKGNYISSSIITSYDKDGNIIKTTDGKLDKTFTNIVDGGFSYATKTTDNKIVIVGWYNNIINRYPYSNFTITTIDYKYDIEKPDVEHATYTVSAPTSDGVEYNSDVEIIPTVELGYDLKKVGVIDKNNVEEIITPTNEGKYIFKSPASDMKINIVVEPKKYKFIEGMNSTYIKKNLNFKLDGIYSLLDKVYINGKILDSENYTTKQGSTIINLKDAYLKTLKPGTYEIKVTYTNTSSDTTKFTIPSEKDKDETPKTGI